MSNKPGVHIGPYTLVRPLGRGAFGVVWLAEKQTKLTRTQVAVKIPHVTNLDLDAVAAEAQIWVKASGHPNVLPIIEADIYDEQLVIVSEYAADGTLRDYLRDLSRPVETETALNLTIDILRGLQFLHERGVVHRDLKPANILFQRDVPRITDFGISRLLDQHSSSGVAGTFAYMAPEAFAGIRNEQTDIWAVGIILFELLSLTHPFQDDDIPSLIRSITSDRPLPYLPGEKSSFSLERVMRNALEKNPNERYKTTVEMLDDLRSDVIRFEMILRPRTRESMASGNTKVCFPSQADYLEKPRIQHYAFTRDYLRNRAFAIPGPFVDDLIDKDKGKRKLQFYWGVNARELALNDPYIPPSGLDCFPFSESGRFVGVVISLPQPVGYVEAFFVATILVYLNPPSEEEYELRYFTLDLGKGRGENLRTILSEWGHDGHIYSEEHRVKDLDDFRTLVTNHLPDYEHAIPDPDGSVYPFAREFQYSFREAPPLRGGEVEAIESLIDGWMGGSSFRSAVEANEKGFSLILCAKQWITRKIGNELFAHLARNYLANRGGGYSYISIED